MAEQERNIDTLVVPRAGRVEGGPGGLVPYRVVDASGAELAAVTEFLRNLSASDCSPATCGHTPTSFSAGCGSCRQWACPGTGRRGPRREITRSGWPGLASRRGSGAGTVRRRERSTRSRESRIPAETYAIATRRHARAVIHAFYEYHRVRARASADQPVPCWPGCCRRARSTRITTRCSRGGGQGGRRRISPGPPKRVPRAIPDERFNEVFAALASHRDRALLAFWISTGARAQELLTVVRGRVDPPTSSSA